MTSCRSKRPVYLTNHGGQRMMLTRLIPAYYYLVRQAMKDRLLDLLKQLTAIDGISSYEHDVVRFLRDSFSPIADSVEIDALGNLTAVRRGKQGPRLMISAHSDEIGLMVKSIEESGFLRFEKIGGATDPFLPGRKVTVRGNLGVIGARPGHLVAAEGKHEITRHSELYIDVGVRSRAEVEALNIRIGDPIAFRSELEAFANSDRVCGKSIDNRAGCAALIKLFEELAGQEIDGTLYGTVCVQEEVGCRGAGVVANRLDPDFAIVFDTIPACDTPDCSLTKDMNSSIGRGVIIPAMSGDWNLGHMSTPAMKKFLTDLAEAEGIPYQIATFPAATTDAAAINLAGHGIPTGVINIPRRYSHTPVEVLDINDLVAAVRLARAAVRDMGRLSSLSFI